MKATTKEKVNKVSTVKKEKIKINSLDELFNVSNKKRSLIKATSYAEYKQEIERMNLADLQSHAISLSLKPSRNRSMLEKGLLNNYVKHNASMVPTISVDQNASVKNLDKVLKILSRGA